METLAMPQWQWMHDLWHLVSTNQFAGGLAAAVVMALLVAGYRKTHHWRDRRRVKAFLEESAKSTPHTFRSTQAIAAAVGLTESRVEVLCSAHPKIHRNGAEKNSWRLAD